MEALVKLLTAHLLLISPKIDVCMALLKIVDSDTFGTEIHVLSILQTAQLELHGVDQLARIQANAEMVIILDHLETAFHSPNNALHQLNGTEQNVLLLEISAPNKLTLKETSVSHIHLVKMDLSGIPLI